MENPIKMDDLGVPLFSETAISMILNHRKKITGTVSTFEAPDLSIGTFFSAEAAIFLILGIS